MLTKVQFETNHRELFDKKVDEEDLNYIYSQAIAQDDVVMDGQVGKQEEFSFDAFSESHIEHGSSDEEEFKAGELLNDLDQN